MCHGFFLDQHAWEGHACQEYKEKHDKIGACLMSRGDELRQFAAQHSVLAALVDSIALGLSRVMGLASPGLLLPMLVHPQLRSASFRAASPRTCTRSRSPAPPCTASQFQRRLWLAWVGCSRGVGSGHGLGHQELPTPRLSRSPRCLSRLAAICRRLRALCTLVLRSLRPTPTTNGTLSLTHTASHRLLVAPRPPSPSRPSPLVLVGVLATSVAVVSAKPPSAPCGGTFDLVPLPSCALSPGAASLFDGLLWVRAHFRGSCGSVGRYGPLLRLPSSSRALSSVVDAGSGTANSSATLKMRRSPTSAILIPGNGHARQSSSRWSSSLAKGLHRRRTRCSWTSFLCSRVNATPPLS